MNWNKALVLANTLQLQFGGVGVQFSAEREELRAAIGHIYQAFLVDPDQTPANLRHQTPPHETSASWSAHVNRQSFFADNFDLAVRTVEDAIADCLLQSVTDHLLIHAATVLHGSTAIILVGKSGSGKTTSALELVRRGMLYVTDEFTAISPCATTIHPFPRSATRKFESRTPSGDNLVINGPYGFRTHMLPEHRSGLQPLAIQRFQIIFPTFKAGYPPVAKRIGSAELCSRLMPSIFDFEHRERELWTAISNLATRSVACELTYRDATTDLDLALNLLNAADAPNPFERLAQGA